MTGWSAHLGRSSRALRDEPERLRVLIVNECKGRLALIAPIVLALGYEVVASQVDVQNIGAVSAREWPDVALVGLGDSSQRALELIDKIVREAICPVIVLIHARDPDFLQQTSKRGAFAHISDDDEDWRSSIDIVLRRFTAYHGPAGAFGRRALIECAKGILMERHATDATSAFEMMLREHSRTDNRSLIGLAGAIVDGHRLLPKRPSAPPRPSSPACARAVSPLQHANAVRVARAELKRDVQRGAVSVGEVILDPPWQAARMTIAELLSSQRQWGSTRSRKFLAGIAIPETKTIASLTERQRSLLATKMGLLRSM